MNDQSPVEDYETVERALRRVQRDIARSRIELSVIAGEAAPTELTDAWEEFTKQFRAAFEGLKTLAKLLHGNEKKVELETELSGNEVLNFVRQCRNSIQYNGGAVVNTAPESVITGSPSAPSLVHVSGGGRVQVSRCTATIVDERGHSRTELFGHLFASGLPSAEGYVQAAFPARAVGPFLELVPVTNRGKTFPPPRLSDRIEQNVESVAEYAIYWLEEKLKILEAGMQA